MVYGHDAIAVSLSDLRVPAEARLPHTGSFALTLPALGAGVGALTHAWPLPALRASALCAGLAAAAPPEPPLGPLPRATAPTPELQAALAALVQGIADPAHRRACAPLLYLACAIFLGPHSAPHLPGLALTVQPPTLPVGAGLGSSAAVSTAAAAALLGAHAAASWPTPLNAAAREAINAWAFAAETLFHGAPSGLDNTVATHGGALVYSRAGGVPRFRALASALPLRLLLVNTHVPKDTAALVAGVGALRAAHPGLVTPLLECIGALVGEAAGVLEGAAPAPGAAALPSAPTPQAHLAQLIRINHSVLNALGVGHAALDAVVAAAAELGLAGKLTGAGGGGCAFVLLPAAGEGEAQEAALTATLTAKGFHCFSTRVGGDGVAVELLP